MTARIPMEGRTFGRLTVLRIAGIDEQGHRQWECKCNGPKPFCIGVAKVGGNQLRSGKTKSCGCLQREHAQRTIPAARSLRHAKHKQMTA